MNKRQRKKQRTRNNRCDLKLMQELSRCFRRSEFDRKYDLLLAPHRRRHWMSVAEFTKRRNEFLAEIAAEEAELQTLMLTHVYTLGGWVPKEKFERKQ